jgi:threonine dehydratase
MVRPPAFKDIRTAHGQIKPYIHHTPVLTCSAIDDLCGAALFFKCENFQKAGAFKIRGAANTVLSLPESEAAKGVATHSSGNHAAALALAARWRGIRAIVVMPENTPAVKKAAVAGYGAEIVYCEPTLQAREAGLEAVVRKTGAVFIHPYNDPRIIAGQGTAALELLEDAPALDTVMAPVGGGGLLSGTALSVSALSPETAVIAAEPAEADDACRSFRAGRIIPSVNPKTIADGLRTSLGDLTFAVIREHVKDIVTVSEAGIVHAMRTIWERMKIVVEPSAAVPLAALLEGRLDLSGQRAGIILSGGNAALDQLPW